MKPQCRALLVAILRLVTVWRCRVVQVLPGREVLAIMGSLCSTPCQLMVLNLEDLIKGTEQQNLPGTTAEYPNWRRKMKYKVEELKGGAAKPFTNMLREWLKRTGRVNPGPR